MLPQSWNNMQSTVRKPWKSLAFASAHDQRESEVVEPPRFCTGKDPKHADSVGNLAGGTDKYVCSCDNTADSSTEEIARNDVPNQSPTLLLIGFPTSAHLKCLHFAPENTTHQSQDKRIFRQNT